MNTHLIVGIGNDFRGDDGAGLLVARLLQQARPPGVAVLQQSGEAGALLEAWQGYEMVTVVDAAHSGAPPGTIHRFDPRQGPLPAHLSRNVSSHAFGLAAAIELARRLDRLPPRLVVYAVEGHDFTPGAALTPAVAHAAEALARRLQHPNPQSPIPSIQYPVSNPQLPPNHAEGKTKRQAPEEEFE